jgi:adenine-specific DNA-methyltransferase
LGVTRNGGYFEYKPMFVENIPIPLLSKTAQQPLSVLVEQIIRKKENNEKTSDLENDVDQLVYKLYGLT